VRFLADQDVYQVTIRFLRENGHDVLTAREANLSRAEDITVMLHASEDNRILVTRDRDFGHLVVRRDLMAGVLYLRSTPVALDSIHTELAQILETYSEEQLRSAFIVVEPGRHRYRKRLG
jgi:predicted nuclease of predicted toxin-antitoxin system